MEEQTTASVKHSQAPGPVTSLDDPRAIQILSTEHWSLLTSRSLAYNEAFTRGGMFLTFLSMSFVALALLASAMSFGEQFLTIAAIVLAFDFVIGLTTYGRIMGANEDDLRAVQGMARIRHAYVEIAPLVGQYFTSPTNDDIASIVSTYGQTRGNDTLYAFTTSGGMIGLITAMVAGVFASVLALMLGASGDLAIWIGAGGAGVVLITMVRVTFGAVARTQRELGTMFPAEKS
ncbi:MAG TPA: hypothetical protein VJ975_05640 [Candidatus Limnocylindria bacterium]|nr:hypothetical protein [Candidatus Limnocylindria bacterium]